MDEPMAMKGFEAIQRLDSTLKEPGAAIDPAALCQKYRQIKPDLLLALALLKAFPFIGKGIVSAIQFLMQAADQLCPAPPPPTPAP